jgi:superfamily II DNA helicase RecQ
MPLSIDAGFLWFSDPIEPELGPPDSTETPQNHESQNRNELQWEAGLNFIGESTGYELRAGQKEALEKLYRGDDVVLVAMTGYGKTLIYTGFHAFFPASARAITLIISPLLAIEQDQAEELVKRFGNSYKPFAVNGRTNTSMNRHAIARGEYTHVWVSAEIVLGDLLVEGRSSAKRIKRTYNDGYCDSGTFTSVIQDSVFQERLKLVAIDELHLCAVDSWGGGFRKAMGQLRSLREQLEDHTRLFGTTATLTKCNWTDIRMSAGFDPQLQPIRTSVYRSDVFLPMHVADR